MQEFRGDGEYGDVAGGLGAGVARNGGLLQGPVLPDRAL